MGSRPVAGRPRFFSLAFIDIFEYWFSLKASRGEGRNFRPALTRATTSQHWQWSDVSQSMKRRVHSRRILPITKRPPEDGLCVLKPTSSRPFSSFLSTSTWPSFSCSFCLSSYHLWTCCRSGLRDLSWLGLSGLSIEPYPPRKTERGQLHRLVHGISPCGTGALPTHVQTFGSGRVISCQ